MRPTDRPTTTTTTRRHDDDDDGASHTPAPRALAVENLSARTLDEDDALSTSRDRSICTPRSGLTRALAPRV